MAINGYCTGASKGLVYIRAEYPLAVERLKIAIQQAKEYGFLGENIFGTDFSFDIQIRYGAGAFVCGEETALIHSMEGLRGEATVKPPFPSEHGYKGCPTNVNNVENRHHTIVFIHHNHTARPHHGTGRYQVVVVDWQVQMLFCKTSAGRASGHGYKGYRSLRTGTDLSEPCPFYHG